MIRRILRTIPNKLDALLQYSLEYHVGVIIALGYQFYIQTANESSSSCFNTRSRENRAFTKVN